MGTFQLGRVGIETTSGEVHAWSSGSRGITVEGHTQYGSVGEALVIREQILGYVELPDEDFVPVVWSEQPEVDGFYRVVSAQVSAVSAKAPLGILDWSVDLERVQGFAAPLIEDTVLGALRPNGVGQTPVNAVAFPSQIRSVDYVSSTGTRIPTSPDFVRTGATGAVVVHSTSGTNSPLYSYYVAPEDYYEGAATLRMGDPLRVVVGRQVRNTVGDFELSNDLIQVRSFFGTRFDIQFRVWLSSGWSDWETLTFQQGLVATDIPAPHSITVLRNSPDAVAIRLLAASSRNPIQIDLVLRRGARYVAASYNQIMGALPVVKTLPHTTIATVGGFYWFATGYLGYVASPVAINGASAVFSPTTFPNNAWQFCFGAGENPAVGSDDINRAIHEYFWAASERQSVVVQ